MKIPGGVVRRDAFSLPEVLERATGQLLPDSELDRAISHYGA